MSDTQREPCGNEDCDLCYPLPRFKVSTERVQRLFHTRVIKAKDADEARRIYDQGTAWPSSYDDRGGEVIEEHPPTVTLVPPLEEPIRSRIESSNCFHNLNLNDFPTLALTSCDFVGDMGCSDPTCEKCHGAPKQERS